MQRPSGRELHIKVTAALAAITAGDYQFPLLKHLSSDLDQLEVTDETELIELVAEALREILAANPADCWAGGYPPSRSYEREIRDLELWAFAWDSAIFGRRMYLKFALKRDVYLYIDCHGDNP